MTCYKTILKQLCKMFRLVKLHPPYFCLRPPLYPLSSSSFPLPSVIIPSPPLYPLSSSSLPSVIIPSPLPSVFILSPPLYPLSSSFPLPSTLCLHPFPSPLPSVFILSPPLYPLSSSFLPSVVIVIPSILYPSPSLLYDDSLPLLSTMTKREVPWTCPFRDASTLPVMRMGRIENLKSQHTTHNTQKA